ncbi:hypothetical protein [Streptomyces sp. NPDC093260]|uniref:hypothetical protein n=1 Tax=Streptomyces sp. NPDC093260 TaxID=3155073 RepID=UPI003423129C
MIGGVAAAVVGGFFTLSNTVLDHSLGSGDKPGGDQTTASAPTPSESSTAKPSPSEATSSAVAEGPKTYTVDYSDRKMSLTLPAGYDVSAVDFDAPSVRIYGDDEYAALTDDAATRGETAAPDLIYHDHADGHLEVGDKRPAVQMDDVPPTTPEECAAQAETGGFNSLSLKNWPVEAKSGFCLVTDQGNVVRVEITRLTGGYRSESHTGESPAERIDFTATMWKAT